MKKSNKKVLFIAYLFPPILNSGTYRSVKFVKYLPEFGWEPIVLTVEHPPDRPLEPALLDEVPKNIKVIRVPMISRSIANAVGKICPSKFRTRFVDGIEWRLRRFWCIPDVHAAWRISAIRGALKIYKQSPFDIIFATGYPWTSFLVGKEISRRLNKPLVLDYRDPWTGGKLWNNSNRKSSLKAYFLEKISQSLEQSVVKQAKILIATTEAFSQELSKLQSKNPSLKIYTITNGYDPEDFKKADTLFDKEPDKIYIVFVGVWKKGYGPEDLYKALKILKERKDPILSKLKVVCAGFEPGYAKKLGISEEVQEIGYVSHEKAVGLMKSADILYMSVPVGRFSQMCLPGKLFEYIGAEKPLLISSLPDSCVANFVRNYEFALIVEPSNLEDLIRKLRNLVDNFSFFVRKSRNSLELRKKIDRRFLTKKLAQVFDSLY